MDLRVPWLRLVGEQAGACEQEAIAEIADGHELNEMSLAAVAKCEGCSQVVFSASDGTFAIVDLTWSGRPETPPRPRTQRLGGYVAVELVMDQHAH